MVEFTLKQVVEAVGGRLLQGDPDTRIQDVSADSRKIHPGELFIALKGERFDGHHFIETVAKRQAAAAIVMDPVTAPPGLALIQVPDSLRALGALAGAHRKRFSIPVIGITGSNGKTTTKDLIAAVLEEKYRIVKTEKNFNNEIGLPLTLFRVDSTTEAAVVEMGMRGMGQIRQLASFAAPTIAVITNVGLTHLELLGSRENIAKAKAELVEGLLPGELAVLNGDDPLVRPMAQMTAARAVYYGIDGEDLNYRAVDLENDNGEWRFKVKSGPDMIPMTLPLPGRHNIQNALAAIAVSRELGLGWETIRRGLSAPQMTGNRLNILERNGLRIIDDTYNASPTSVKAALDVLTGEMGKRRIAVLADMLELGPESGMLHYGLGVYAAHAGIDRMMAYGELAKEYVAGFTSVKEGGTFFATKSALIGTLKKELASGDVILVKGSRGMKMEEIVAAVSEGENA